MTSNVDRLEAWEKRTGPILTAAAILPIAVAFTQRGQSEPAIWVDLASWLIFLVDLVVHVSLRRRYLRTKLGMFDLAIVVITAPWYLVPGLNSGRLLSLARLGRLARVFVASKHSRKLQDLGRRLGTAALYGLALMVCCAIVVHAVEPASSGFSSFGDAMWWAVVTFTTVGYGDFYPTTSAGRGAAVLLMLGGIALIGSLAGTLGTFFGSSDAPPLEPAPDTAAEVLAEIRLLRTEVAELRAAAEPPAQ
jgi:voltage-gated potassium channel